ncbi:hypothetical protein ACQ4PT_040827 [Festuca glaucescens]
MFCVQYGSLDIHASNWRLNAHADVVDLHHHVHLVVEGVALNGWTDQVAARVLHYFDTASLVKEDATALKLWAWSADPNKIPKVVYLTVAANPSPTSDGTAPCSVIGRSGLQRRVLVHLDLHEDYTPDRHGQVPRRVHAESFDITLGIVDGESAMRERRRPPSGRRDHRGDDRDRRDDDERRRRDDDDDRARRRREGARRSWTDRIFRSRSRPADRRNEDRSQDNRDNRRRDGRDYRGGRDDRRRGLTLLGRSTSAASVSLMALCSRGRGTVAVDGLPLQLAVPGPSPASPLLLAWSAAALRRLRRARPPGTSSSSTPLTAAGFVALLLPVSACRSRLSTTASLLRALLPPMLSLGQRWQGVPALLPLPRLSPWQS